MLPLPTEWESKSLSWMSPSRDILYGFSYDPEQYTYGFYLTNFNKVWAEEVEGKETFNDIAERYGFEDLSLSKVKDLFQLLYRGIYKEPSLSFESTNRDIKVSLNTNDFNWEFSLKRQDQPQCIEFLAKLNFQQFANHNYLQYKIEDLKRTVEVKDRYIRFLSENFKQSHGTELLAKYRRNNKDDLMYIANFNNSKWETSINRSYKRLRQKSNRDVQADIRDKIRTSISDRQTWKSDQSLSKDSEALTVETSPEKPAEAGGQFIKAPPDESPTDSPKDLSKDTSPKKRTKKLGMMKSSKRSSSQAFGDSSQLPSSQSLDALKDDGVKEDVSPTKKTKRFGMTSSKKKK
ncbi:uncharacterized protein RJT20DRAFT_31265 [Scheffersomyces xylosifermentans]|uniref:uncharacterized protein n=1 Tax=Scheffersomyces xylosifermentans TaxID=1304137 RepID=UPI00315D7755